VGPERRVTLDRPELGIHDYEVQQAYRAVTADPVEPSSSEVAELRLIGPEELRTWLHAEPESFSPGFHRDVIELGLLDSDSES
jgi:isopentenyldiphosphate isomerase